MNEPTPRIDVTIAAPLDIVWEALREKHKIQHWHGWDFDGLAGEIDLIYFAEAKEDAAARTLDVQGGDHIALTPDGTGTALRLTRAPHGDDPEWDAYYDDITEGWTTFLHQLKFLLERRPGGERRTVFLSGENPASRSVAADLGLPDGPAGTSVALNLLGQDVRGEIWFRSAHQVGVTVDAWGDGLLVVSSVPAGDAKPKGAVMAVLSTFDRPANEVADLAARWQPWWDERYPS
jgi:uncharacterized protein YndB with AHSA1/START domain